MHAPSFSERLARVFSSLQGGREPDTDAALPPVPAPRPWGDSLAVLLSRHDPAPAPLPPPAPPARPASHLDVLRRARTFRASQWFGKPARLSPLECARRGWVCAGADALRCEWCGSSVRAPAVAAVLRTGHSLACPWRTASCPPRYSRLPPLALPRAARANIAREGARVAAAAAAAGGEAAALAMGAAAGVELAGAAGDALAPLLRVALLQQEQQQPTGAGNVAALSPLTVPALSHAVAQLLAALAAPPAATSDDRTLTPTTAAVATPPLKSSSLFPFLLAACGWRLEEEEPLLSSRSSPRKKRAREGDDGAAGCDDGGARGGAPAPTPTARCATSGTAPTPPRCVRVQCHLCGEGAALVGGSDGVDTVITAVPALVAGEGVADAAATRPPAHGRSSSLLLSARAALAAASRAIADFVVTLPNSSSGATIAAPPTQSTALFPPPSLSLHAPLPPRCASFHPITSHVWWCPYTTPMPLPDALVHAAATRVVAHKQEEEEVGAGAAAPTRRRASAAARLDAAVASALASLSTTTAGVADIDAASRALLARGRSGNGAPEGGVLMEEEEGEEEGAGSRVAGWIALCAASLAAPAAQ